MRRVTLVYRDERFSPHAVMKDRAILEAVGLRLRAKGYRTAFVDEGDLRADDTADAFLTMGRSEHALDVLAEMERQGRVVVNGSRGVRTASDRCGMDSLMRREGVATAPRYDSRPTTDGDGFWVKRGEGTATTADDVTYARTWNEVEMRVNDLQSRGFERVLVSGHLMGDIVKFYGIAGSDFFSYTYPTDDGDSKFGNERVNGAAHHFTFSEEHLREEARRLAVIVGLTVYGGDAIVRSDGSVAIIDFNDWPSFSCCRDEAADAIADVVDGLMKSSADDREKVSGKR